MSLFFCPACRKPFGTVQVCPDDNIQADDPPRDYVERLLETVLSDETNRAGMAVDVLTKWLHEQRAIVPLSMLLARDRDPYSQVIGARGLGWLGNPSAVPALAELLLNGEQPFVARVAAAEALGKIGGRKSRQVLEIAVRTPRPSVAEASEQALEQIREQENQE